jgi:hypothetical protein
MPWYALTIGLGVSLAAKRQGGWFSLWIGCGSLPAALFDATEDIALLMILGHKIVPR